MVIIISGRYMASGQINYMGFPGYVILWDFEDRHELSRHNLHKVFIPLESILIVFHLILFNLIKVRVQSICFTAQDKYVISIGGHDDGSVIVFDIEAR